MKRVKSVFLLTLSLALVLVGRSRDGTSAELPVEIEAVSL